MNEKFQKNSNASTFGNCSFIPGIKPLLESPGVTPIKPLPFSPSQFLNSPTVNLHFDSKIPASTPVHKYSNQKVYYSSFVPNEYEYIEMFKKKFLLRNT